MAITPFPPAGAPSEPGSGGLTMVTGTNTFEGDNSKDILILPHGLASTPRFATAVSQELIPFAVTLAVTWDATNVTIKFQEPPRYGTIVIVWSAWI